MSVGVCVECVCTNVYTYVARPYLLSYYYILLGSVEVNREELVRLIVDWFDILQSHYMTKKPSIVGIIKKQV